MASATARFMTFAMNPYPFPLYYTGCFANLSAKKIYMINLIFQPSEDGFHGFSLSKAGI
jgi:hypothetical protein